MVFKDAKKRMKAEQNKKCKLQTTTDQTPRKPYQIVLLNYNVNVPCKSKYSVVPTTFSTYPRIAVSIIAIILISNPKPYFVDKAIWKQVILIFSRFYLV
jgi:hypothetical protein